MPHYTCRPANEEDVELLFRVYASTREEELASVAWTPEQKEAFCRMQFAAQDTHYRRYYDGATFEIVLVDGQPAGRLYLHRTASEIRIMDVTLLPAFRRQGLGERMLRDIFSEADRAGKLVSIHVEHMNPARRLYERVGFEAVDEGEESAVYVRMDRAPATSVLQPNTT